MRRPVTIAMQSMLPLAMMLLGPVGLRAGIVETAFLNAPTGWSVNRYAPNSFANIGTYQGKDNVIGLGISNADGIGSRPSPYNFDFFNTQGMQYDLAGGAGTAIDLALYIPADWSNPSLGNRTASAWGVLPIIGMPCCTPSSYGYSIAGFTNYDGAARYRVWDNNTGWVDLATPVVYDQWTHLRILFTGSAIEYSVNGALVYTDSEPATFSGVSALLLMGYNFNDPGLSGAVANDYTAYWAAVPEPGSMSLLGVGLGLLGLWRRRR